MNIRHHFALGVAWSAFGAAVRNISAFVVFIAIARLLSPAEIGLVAFAMVFIDVSRVALVNGIPDALVQRPEWDQSVATSAFWMVMVISIGLAVALGGVVAPIAYKIYDETFALVLASLSLLLLIEGLSAIHVAELRRTFQFDVLAKRGMILGIGGGIGGVMLAWYGWGVWALVISRIAALLGTSVLLWVRSGFRPGFSFAAADVRPMRGYSVRLGGSALLGVTNSQLPSFAIGLFVGPAALGIFKVASNALYTLISVVFWPVQNVAMSAFSRLRDDPQQFQSAYIDMVRVYALLSCPIFIGAAAIAPDFVVLAFGEKWSEAGIIMSLLALAVGAQVLVYINGPALAATGRTDLNLKQSALDLLSTVATLAVTVPAGLLGIAFGQSVRAYAMIPITQRLVRIGTGIAVSDAFRAVAPALAGAAVMGAAVSVLRVYPLADMHLVVRVALCVAAGVPIYLAAMLILFRSYTMGVWREAERVMPAKFRRFVPGGRRSSR